MDHCLLFCITRSMQLKKKSNLDQKKPSTLYISFGKKEVKGLKKIKLNTIYLYKQHIIFFISSSSKHKKRWDEFLSSISEITGIHEAKVKFKLLH